MLFAIFDFSKSWDPVGTGIDVDMEFGLVWFGETGIGDGFGEPGNGILGMVISGNGYIRASMWFFSVGFCLDILIH